MRPAPGVEADREIPDQLAAARGSASQLHVELPLEPHVQPHAATRAPGRSGRRPCPRGVIARWPRAPAAAVALGEGAVDGEETKVVAVQRTERSELVTLCLRCVRRPPCEHAVERGSLEPEHCIAIDEPSFVQRATRIREAGELVARCGRSGESLDLERERVLPHPTRGVVGARLLRVHGGDGVQRVEHQDAAHRGSTTSERGARDHRGRRCPSSRAIAPRRAARPTPTRAPRPGARGPARPRAASSATRRVG